MSDIVTFYDKQEVLRTYSNADLHEKAVEMTIDHNHEQSADDH